MPSRENLRVVGGINAPTRTSSTVHPFDTGAFVLQPNLTGIERAYYAFSVPPSSPEKKSERTVTDTPSREELDAKLGKLSAETDTKIARLEGKLDLVLSKMEEVAEGNRATRANQWVIGTALAVLMVALAFGIPAVFGNGLQLRDVIHSEVQDTLTKTPPAKP